MIKVVIRRKIVNAKNRDNDRWYRKEITLPRIPAVDTEIVFRRAKIENIFIVCNIRMFEGLSTIHIDMHQDNTTFKDQNFARRCQIMEEFGFEVEGKKK